MFKKILALFTLFTLAFTLTACLNLDPVEPGDDNDTNDTVPDDNNDKDPGDDNDDPDPGDDNDDLDPDHNDDDQDIEIIYYDMSPYQSGESSTYPSTSNALSIQFESPLTFTYSYLDPYEGTTCYVIDSELNERECVKETDFTTAALGEYTVTYYAEDEHGDYVSQVFTKAVLRDASLLNYDYTYNPYYEGIEGLYGDALKEALQTILASTVRLRTYGDARDDLQVTDRDPNNSSNVIQLYTRQSVRGLWDLGATWNREHVWPQAFLPVSSSNNTANMASDLHNLTPADPQENNTRASRFFTETGEAGTYIPDASIRGNLARMMFYMDVMYDALNLVSANTPVNTYDMGHLDALIAWHFLDTPDDFEENRNTQIYNFQSNRNPFIDYPHLVELIWFDHENIPLP